MPLNPSRIISSIFIPVLRSKFVSEEDTEDVEETCSVRAFLLLYFFGCAVHVKGEISNVIKR